MIVFPSYLSSLGKKRIHINLHDDGTYVLLTDSCQIFGRCLRENNVLCADCVRPSVCYIILDYILKLHRSSAQGISQGASGAAALGSSDQGRIMGYN